ncbi:hypothetical protein T440DRAFT_504062 [Plenodomus tracheiphilus IPT5]|uniref:Ankyrin n=1 Tax=Plenodomus tracheiphilus IPT5 TaxID=1408161 RepID=A0A6A7BJ30_9PLEO|nr:hypothetical protein T440DRAFT_504062 [Plenodomus tracheiphilus IPT5]
MPANSILRGFESPTWNLARSACETDDTSLIEQAISSCPQQDDPEGLKRYICRHAIQNNAENALKCIIEQGLDVHSLAPTVVAGDGRSKAILEILLAHGWDINYRQVSTSGPDAEPFMWHIVKDGDLVTWCLEHGASVFPRNQEPLRVGVLTQSQRSCRQILDCAAGYATITTFELLRSKGAPLGWRTLHLAVQTAALAADRLEKREDEDCILKKPESKEGQFNGNHSDAARNYAERMDMVRHLIDTVGLDVNGLDHPAGRTPGGCMGPPICYVATLSGLRGSTRELTWLLLDRGADPAPGLEEAGYTDHETFAGDVEAWKARNPIKSRSGASKCTIQ